MKRTRYSEEQIIGILTEHEAGAKCADLCRKHGMSEGTFYAWKAKFGGMTCQSASNRDPQSACKRDPLGIWVAGPMRRSFQVA